MSPIYEVWRAGTGMTGKRARYPVASPEEGARKIAALALAELNNPRIVWNAFGLEVMTDDGWAEWYDDEGRDVDEAFNVDAAIEAGKAGQPE